MTCKRCTCALATFVVCKLDHSVFARAAPATVIQLSKHYVPVVRKGRIVSHQVSYFGTIHLGEGKSASTSSFPRSPSQSFNVVFDTGSAHLFVPSSTCESKHCLTHRTYNRAASQSAVDIRHVVRGNQTVVHDEEEPSEVSIAYGTGQVSGHVIHETVCLGGRGADAVRGGGGLRGHGTAPTCVRAKVVLATRVSERPFDDCLFDGIFGLGLESLAFDAEFSVMGQLVAQHPDMEASFGMFLSRDDRVASELSLGGYDERRIAGELRWAPVVRPELGHWLLQVRSVRVGDIVLDVCDGGECVAIADSGTSVLGVPHDMISALHGMLAREVDPDPGKIDCREHPGLDIVISLGEVELTLRPQDYSRAAGMRVVNRTDRTDTLFFCRAELLSVSPGNPLANRTWILGEPVLRRYYSVFDWHRRRVGFAPSAGVSGTPATAQPFTFGASTPVIVPTEALV